MNLLDSLIAALFSPLDLQLSLFGSALSTSGAEIGGFTFGVCSVWLAARNRFWTWPVGIANGFFWLLLFVDSALTAGLQLVFSALSLLGWYRWQRTMANYAVNT